MNNKRHKLESVYTLLHNHFGPLHWWPADTPFEVAIGAILTQNTTWRNVEKAISNLRIAEALTPANRHDLSRKELEVLIRPAGFFRQKAERLHLLASVLCELYEGRIEELLEGDLEMVRKRLLEFKGIGPETADSILLYAGGKPSFVVDAYTMRLFTRLGVLNGHEDYTTIRALFMSNLEEDTTLFNEYHAAIVEMCKQYCRKRVPACPECPLLPECPQIGFE